MVIEMPLDLVAEVRCFFGRDCASSNANFRMRSTPMRVITVCCVDEFTVGVREHAAADGGIFALGVLAHHPEIDIAGLAVGERRRHARHQPHRAQIDVLVELAPEFDQRAPQRNVIGDFRGPADRAEIDRVVLADLRLPVLRHHLAVLLVIVPGREIEMIEMHGDAVLFRRRLQHAQALRHHFLADAVAGNDRDPILLFGCSSRDSLLPGRAANAAYLIALQWTKPAAAQRCSAMLTACGAPA